MVLTMNDMLKHFSVSTGYTHSDEITLIFKPAEDSQPQGNNSENENENKEDNSKRVENKVHMFNGRSTKILTLMASYCSIRFN